jgi:hypothetical protein
MITVIKNLVVRKRGVLLAIVLSLVVLTGWSGSMIPPSGEARVTVPSFQSRMLEVGEELEYKVSYSFFTIGTIRTQVIAREVRNGKTIYRTRAIMESNPSLSWLVDLHIQFHGEMDAAPYSLNWLADDSTSREINFRRFRFDYDNNRAILERGKRRPTGGRTVEQTDTVRIDGKCQDGLSLLFYARENVHSVGQQQIATLIENKPAFTTINFTNNRSEVEIDAVDYPIDVVKFDGRADYVGVFGLTGGFRGWFSNDEQQIPILARMNVILGSIKIQLAKWHRPGWQPPKYVEVPAK